MTIDNQFGPESKSKESRTLRLKVLKPIYEPLEITEAASQYLNQKTHLSSLLTYRSLLSCYKWRVGIKTR